MLRLVPALRALYEAESDVPVNDGDPSPREQFFADDANFTDAHYFEFLFRRQFIRQLVLDTNNVMVDIEAGTGSTLEGFKRLHRLVDVMKAVEERNKATLENARLEHRLDAGQLDDPDIENMTVVTARCTTTTDTTAPRTTPRPAESRWASKRAGTTSEPVRAAAGTRACEARGPG